jgi:hypothetical protein
VWAHKNLLISIAVYDGVQNKEKSLAQLVLDDQHHLPAFHQVKKHILDLALQPSHALYGKIT